MKHSVHLRVWFPSTQACSLVNVFAICNVWDHKNVRTPVTIFRYYVLNHACFVPFMPGSCCFHQNNGVRVMRSCCPFRIRCHNVCIIEARLVWQCCKISLVNPTPLAVSWTLLKIRCPKQQLYRPRCQHGQRIIVEVAGWKTMYFLLSSEMAGQHFNVVSASKKKKDNNSNALFYGKHI